MSIQPDESQRIARHLHDTLGHDLAYLCMKLDQLADTGQVSDSQALHSEIKSIRLVANEAYEHVRSLINDLRGEPQDSLASDLVSTIKECVLLIGESAGFTVNFEVEGNPVLLPAQTEREILYLAREALRNIEKHAQARNVTVTFNWLDNGLALQIADDGLGFDATASQNLFGHHGLKIIREIVSELQGSLSVESGSAQGTNLRMWLPFMN